MTRLEKQWLVDVLEKRRFLEHLKAVDEKMQKDILNEIEAQIKRQLKQYYNFYTLKVRYIRFFGELDRKVQI